MSLWQKAVSVKQGESKLRRPLLAQHAPLRAKRQQSTWRYDAAVKIVFADINSGCLSVWATRKKGGDAGGNEGEKKKKKKKKNVAIGCRGGRGVEANHLLSTMARRG